MPIVTQLETHRHAPPQFLTGTQKAFLLFILKCLVMVAVISTFLFFLGLAAIVLLHFLVTSNAFHRRLIHPSSAGPAAETLPDMETLLPEVSYTTTTFANTLDCPICLDIFQEGDSCRKLAACSHLFHTKCVDRWIEKRPNCPVCRARVDLDPVLSGSGMSGGDQWKRVWAVNFEEGTS